VLLRDELIGFAKSKVMLALWIVMPAAAVAGYLLLPAQTPTQMSGFRVPATMYMSFLISSLAGLVTAVMVAADIVGERTRRVYQLFAIRPIPRGAILWAKFLAVFLCVAVACVLALGLGVAIDMSRGSRLTGGMLFDVLKSFATAAGVIALSAGEATLVGILSGTSLVAAVIIVTQIGQVVTVVPLLPGMFGVLPDQFWIVTLLSFVLAAALVQVAVLLFRRVEL
jgi:ABC-type transport system involved in multi-copper enzyme maturation permease subunit